MRSSSVCPGSSSEVGPDVEAEASKVDRPHDVGEVGGDESARGGAVRGAHDRGPQPVRRAVRDPLLEERRARGPVGEPLQQHRPAAHGRQERLADAEVVVDEVELGLAPLGEEHLAWRWSPKPGARPPPAPRRRLQPRLHRRSRRRSAAAIGPPPPAATRRPAVATLTAVLRPTPRTLRAGALAGAAMLGLLATACASGRGAASAATPTAGPTSTGAPTSGSAAAPSASSTAGGSTAAPTAAGTTAGATPVPGSSTAAGPAHTSCKGVVHIGDSTSVGLISPSYLKDPAATDRRAVRPSRRHREAPRDLRGPLDPGDDAQPDQRLRHRPQPQGGRLQGLLGVRAGHDGHGQRRRRQPHHAGRRASTG